MDWHIVTGSKGGSGKTLLSLMLLSREIQAIAGTTLVLDLNSMNADLSKMLLFGRILGQPTEMAIEEDGIAIGENLILQKTFSIEAGHLNSRKEFVVGWLDNPYKICDPAFFSTIIENIRNKKAEISKVLQTPALNTVLIDTNYHFCNIFSQRAADYKKYKILEPDSVYIWFIWVYRQFENLYHGLRGDHQKQYVGETTQLQAVTNAIEQNLPNTRCFKDGQNITPFMHVISPVALRHSQPNEPSAGLFKKVWQTINAANEDHIEISELFALKDLPVNSCVKFNDWVTHLCDTHQKIARDTDNPHDYFLDILVEAINTISRQQVPHRPCNIIPLSIYEKKLEGYTDADYSDAMLSNLRRFDIYKNFCDLYQKQIVHD